MLTDLTTEKILLIKTLTTGSGIRHMRVFHLLLTQDLMLPQRVINTGRIKVTLLQMEFQLSLVVLLQRQPPLQDFQQSLEVLLKREITGTHMLITEAGTTLMTQALSVCMMTKPYTVNQDRLVRNLEVQFKKIKRENYLCKLLETTKTLEIK